ncbi:oligosaccharide flippase family protein [Litchfieldia salsa]|uniref:Membrane protein involved in the export of O-antigen and teichoic acid n=1 Tax=Litchfieldia salsa TaxID=930152 RepID=A0A1H0W6S2_9BACI|nr:oligosaccharide flippase family protein [Litchfieldia salsa]SDP86171.1 Membrane protein involved in the export of O-antigen and teichoic acid [Litchfieldia salsa]
MIKFNVFLKQLIAYFPSQIIPALVSFGIIILLTRYLSIDHYGSYVLFVTTVSLITTLITQWLIQSIFYYRPKYEAMQTLDEFNYYIDKFILFVLGLSFGIVLIISLLWLVAPELLPYEIIVVIIILIAFQSVFLINQTLQQSSMEVNKYSFHISVSNILKFIFIVITILYFDRNIITMLLLGTTLSIAIFVLPELFNQRRRKKITQKNSSVPFFKSMLEYGLPMLGWFFALTIINISDRYMIGWLNSSREVGIYSANFAVVTSAFGLLFAPLTKVMHPIFMKESDRDDIDTSRIELLMNKFTNLFIISGFPIIVLVIIYAKDISLLLLGKSYIDGSDIIPIITCGFFIWNLAMIGHKGLEIKKQTRKMMNFVIIACVLNVVLNYVFIIMFGYKGATWASFLAFLSYALLVYIDSRKNIKWCFDWKVVTIVSVVGMFNYFIITMINIEMKLTILSLIINSSIYILLYLVLIFTAIKLFKIKLSF